MEVAKYDEKGARRGFIAEGAEVQRTGSEGKIQAIAARTEDFALSHQHMLLRCFFWCQRSRYLQLLALMTIDIKSINLMLLYHIFSYLSMSF